jgi:hypothetical protein
MNLLGQAGGVMAKTESEEDQKKKLVRPRRKEKRRCGHMAAESI